MTMMRLGINWELDEAAWAASGCQTDFRIFRIISKVSISKAYSANVAELSDTNMLKGIFTLSEGFASIKYIFLRGAKPTKFFRRLKVFSFEMRIAFFSIIEGFPCFGMRISFNLRDDDDDNDNDDDDDDEDLTI